MSTRGRYWQISRAYQYRSTSANVVLINSAKSLRHYMTLGDVTNFTMLKSYVGFVKIKQKKKQLRRAYT